MKLKNRSKSKGKKALIITGIILAAIVVISLITLLVGVIVYNQQGKVIDYLLISSYPDKLVYYVGESFDPTGLEFQVVFKNGESTYVNNTSLLTFEGFDSSEPSSEQEITVEYMGFTKTISVVIVEPPKPNPTLESIEVCDLKTTYDIKDWNQNHLDIVGSKIILHYSDGSTTEKLLLKKYISGVVSVLDTPGTIYITVQYSDGVTMVETQVEITITE